MATVDLAEAYLTTGLAGIFATVDLADAWLVVEGAAGSATVDLAEVKLDIFGPGNPPPNFTTVDLAEAWLEVLPGGIPAVYTGLSTVNAGGQFTPTASQIVV